MMHIDIGQISPPREMARRGAVDSVQLFDRLFSVVTVIDAVSAAILPVWVDFTSLKGLPCAPGPATTRRGMLVTNG